MTRALAVRVLSLYGPIGIAGALWLFRAQASQLKASSRRVATGILLAAVWNLVTLLPLQAAASTFGWWRFQAESGLFASMPFDLYLGWVVLWSAVPILAFPALSVPVVAIAMLGLDLVLMPLCGPVVVLGSTWYVGEIVAVCSVLLPAQYLARWTIADRHLNRRAVLQVMAFGGLVLILIPSAVFEHTGGDWSAVSNRSTFWNSILLQLLAIPAVVGLSAVQEFVVRGQGTPIPYDPPRRLVTTGPYAFVANPMQLGAALSLMLWSLMLESNWLAGASLMALFYSAGLAAWHEGEEMSGRFGDSWRSYRGNVWAWWPRWRPYAPDAARLYVAQGCPTCRGVGAWLTARQPRGLDIVAAESHPTRALIRMTYEPACDGPPDEGIAAFARALEHLHFGWAWLGMFIRLPGIRYFLQVLVDASGGGPASLPSQVPVRPVLSLPDPEIREKPLRAGPDPERDRAFALAQFEIVDD